MEYKSIFITGASSGIGEALCYQLAKPGATLGILSLGSVVNLNNVAENCRKKGAEVFVYCADVFNQSLMTECIDDFLERVGSVDLVIANAGIAEVEDSDYIDIDIPMRNMKVNYFGVINTFLPFFPSFKINKKGHLTVISSISSLRSTQNSGAYSASKAAINLWVEGLRLRLLPHKVNVTTIALGFVDTAMTRGNSFWMPGLISSENAAKLILKAIKKNKRFCTLPWQSGFLWRFFHIIPTYLYDLIITYAKKRV
jgi:short-subunit dehydrogenase